MLKKFSIILLSSFLLTGCGLFGEAENAGESTEELQPDPNELYAELVTEVFDESNALLSQFNSLLNQLYAGKVSHEQFAKIVNDIVPKSDELLNKLDTVLYDVEDEVYDFHRELIALINFQHQMFLEGLEMATDLEQEIDKSKLREDYTRIKSEQTVLVQSIKQQLIKVSSDN